MHGPVLKPRPDWEGKSQVCPAMRGTGQGPECPDSCGIVCPLWKFVHACALCARAVHLTRSHPKPSSVSRTILPLGQGTPRQLVQDIFFFNS